MKQESKIKVVLAVASLMLVLCVFNNDVFAGGEAASTGTVTSSIRFPWPLPEGEPPVIRPDVSFFNSSKWPQALQDFLRVELLYGDRKIDALEAKYLVNAAFQSQNKTDANGIVSDI